MSYLMQIEFNWDYLNFSPSTHVKASKNTHNLEACNCHCNLRVTDTIWAVLINIQSK